jgi:hypothetical protein
VPVDYSIVHELRVVHVRAHGAVLLAELLEYFDAVVIQDAMSYRKLFDAREMMPQLSDDDFMVLAARVSAYRLFDPRGPVAVVVTTHDAVLAVSRYANFMGAENRPLRLFASMTDARRWLEEH